MVIEITHNTNYHFIYIRFFRLEGNARWPPDASPLSAYFSLREAFIFGQKLQVNSLKILLSMELFHLLMQLRDYYIFDTRCVVQIL